MFTFSELFIYTVNTAIPCQNHPFYYDYTSIENAMKYWVNVSETALQPQKRRGIFTNLETSIRSSTVVEYHPNPKKRVYVKHIIELLLPEYYQKCSCNKTLTQRKTYENKS